MGPPPDHPGASGEVSPGPLLKDKACLCEEAGDGLSLGMGDLEQRNPSWAKHLPEARHNAAIGGKSINAAKERVPWVVGADLVGEPGHIRRREIGGIGDHEIESFLVGLQPIAGHEARPVPDPKAFRV